MESCFIFALLKQAGVKLFETGLKMRQTRAKKYLFTALIFFLFAFFSFAKTSDSANKKRGEQRKKSADLPRSIIPAKPTAKWTKVWWTDRHQAKLEKAQGGNVDFVMIGDSIIHAWETHGKRVWTQYYKPRKALNLGFSGDRTEHVLWRIQHGEVDHISPKVVVLLIGTNNTAGNDSAKETVAGINAIVKELKSRLPHSRILLLAIFPRGEKPNTPLRKKNDAVNREIAKLADQKQLFFLNINNRFFNKQKQLPSEIMPDFLHPNERGYRIWAEAMEPTLKRLLAMPPLK